MADVFETTKDFSERERAGETIELFRGGLIKPDRQQRTFAMSSLLSCYSEDVDLKVDDLSWLYISGSA